MTLTIELNPDEEARLATAARREGMDPAALAKKLVTEHLPDIPRIAGASPAERVRALLREWQAQDRTPIAAGPEPRPGETPTRALFRQWTEEDAAMTDQEREAEDCLWEDFQKGINETRAALGMRQL